MSSKNKDKPKTLSSNSFPVVGIGASAGGLDAFKKLLKAIPENSGMAFVLVQHLDPNHESMLQRPEVIWARPSNIYADTKPEVSTSKLAEKPVPAPPVKIEDEEIFSMQLVIRNDIPAADEPTATQTLTAANFPADEPAMQDAAGEEKSKAAERLQKLRNLSFNINAADPNNEFEAVPAYIRRNMEFYNQTASVEDFYSNYSVKAGDNNQQAQNYI